MKEDNMSNINDVKNIMELDRWFPMCDVGEIGEDYIHLISWNEDIPKTDFDTIAELIANDGYDVSAFELLEIPHPKVFCFGNEEKGEYFDVVKFFDDKWQFSYIENGSNKLAHSIEEAIMKNEWLK